MDLGLRGRVAFVAASSKGMGRASAELFAAEGGVADCTLPELRSFLGNRVDVLAVDEDDALGLRVQRAVRQRHGAPAGRPVDRAARRTCSGAASTSRRWSCRSCSARAAAVRAAW